MTDRFHAAGVASLVLSCALSAAPSGRQLRIERTISAPAQVVFQAWTEPAIIKRWFPYDAKVHWISDPDVQPRTGGESRWRVASDGNDSEVFSFRGVYRVFRPSRLLVFTWKWDSLPIPGVEPKGSTLVSVQFIRKGPHITTVVLTQSGFRTEAARTAHELGWKRCLNGVAKAIAERKP